MSSSSELPSGTVTFLFTDIEGSTRLLQQLRERYAEALVGHQRVLRAAFAEHGGREIDTQGDSFFVAFRRAKDAVAAAVAGQRALAEHAWPDGVELRVRMGIHTGEPTVGEERYIGLGVHRAARIGAAARGGQVLISQTTQSLLRDDPLPDVSLRDLGERVLKDIDEPERIYALVAPGLAEVAAPVPARRFPERRIAIAVALVVVAIGSGLGAFFSTRSGGRASAATQVAANEVGLIDAASGRILARVPVGTAPSDVAYGDGAIWAANTNADSLSRIDPATEDVRQTIAVGGSPAGVAVSPAAVWLANGSDGTVSRIDPTANEVVQTIGVGNGPSGVAYGAGAVWVANSADGTVSRIDPGSGRVTRTVPAAVGVTALTVAFGRVWAVSPPTGFVVAFDPRTGVISDRIGVGVDPDAIAAGGGAVWVANGADGTVSKIDPRVAAVTATIQVGRTPDAIAADAATVWVANGGDSTLSRIDPASGSVVKTVTIGNPPQGLALSTRRLYVAVRSTGAEHRGGTLRAVFAADQLDSVDPAFAYTPISWSILSMTNDGLVGFRRVGGGEGVQLVPDLAASLPAPADGGRTYTFTLRPGIRYSTGMLVQPDDIRLGIERALEAEAPTFTSPAPQYFAVIAGAARCKPGKRCDLSRGIVTNRLARTISFHLTAPDPDFLTKLALPFADAVPAGTPTRESHAIAATGPYMISVERPKALTVRLVRNPSFREWSAEAQPQGFPAAIVVTWPPQSAPAPGSIRESIQAVERGTDDVAVMPGSPPVPKTLLDQLATQYPSRLRFSTEPATWYVFLNTRVPPFDDVRVRQALSYAFDHDAFGRLLTREYAPTCNILPPNNPGYHRSCVYGFGGTGGLAKARALVRASGTAGQSITLWAPAPAAFTERYAASLLEALGYRTRVKAIPSADVVHGYWQKVLDSRTRVQAGYIGWNADYPSSLAFFQQQFSCGAFVPNSSEFANTNVTELCNRGIDAEISRAAAVQVQDPPAAVPLWQKLERDLLAQAPVVPAYNGRAVVFVSKRIGDYQYHPQWGVLLDQLWVK
jgi:YVTN family beta-propeller protein